MIQQTSDVPRLMWKVHEGTKPPPAIPLEGRAAAVAKADAAIETYFEACCTMQPDEELRKLWDDFLAAVPVPKE